MDEVSISYDDSDPFGDGVMGDAPDAPITGGAPSDKAEAAEAEAVKGYMLKKSPNRLRVNRWQKRWFVLTPNQLSWWERSEHEERSRGALSVVSLRGATVLSPGVDAQRGDVDIVMCVVDAAGHARDLELRAESPEEKRTWFPALTRAAGGLQLKDSVERLEFADEDVQLDEGIPPQREDVEIAYGDLQLGTHLGKGLCSECKEAKLPGVEMALCVKTLHNFEASDRLFSEFGRLVRSMSNVQAHTNVLNFIGACTTPPDLCLVTEKHPYSLSTLLHESGSPPQLSQRKRMGLDIAVGLQHIHKNVGSHGSLRPLNCLVKPDGSICVGDFGFNKIKELTGGGARISNTPGLYSYTAPEMLRSEPESTAADIYSTGVILLELATLTKPLHELNQMAIMGQYGFGGKTLLDEIPADCDAGFSTVIKRCLPSAASERAALSEVITLLS